MGRRVKYLSPERYALVREECKSYAFRRTVIALGGGDQKVIEHFKSLNAAFDDAALSVVGAFEAKVLREDIAFSRGWCKSELCGYSCLETYNTHKMAFVKAIARLLGV